MFFVIGFPLLGFTVHKPSQPSSLQLLTSMTVPWLSQSPFPDLIPFFVPQVIDKDEDENWFRAELNGREGYVPSNYIEMLPHPWYQQKIRRSQAEDMLLAQEDLPEGSRRYKYEGMRGTKTMDSEQNEMACMTFAVC